MSMQSENGVGRGVVDGTRYRIVHKTVYSYSAPVAMCQNQLKMTPISRPGVHVHNCLVHISPTPESTRIHRDFFGNEVTTFAIEALHEKLVVEVESELTIVRSDATQHRSAKAWELIATQLGTPVRSGLLEVGEFVYPSPRISCSDEFRSYALKSFEQGRNLVEAAIDLTKRIFSDFRYDATATNVDTPVHEAFGLKAGVCQDFAQIQIACLRSLGLAARYVSGYLRTLPPPGKEKLIGADESHAWCSIFADQELGWLDLDPTNGCVVGSDHIPICVGRDYLDVSPMRGIAVGGGTPSLSVSVDVRESAPASGDTAANP